jgi:hypothetical protein
VREVPGLTRERHERAEERALERGGEQIERADADAHAMAPTPIGERDPEQQRG